VRSSPAGPARALEWGAQSARRRRSRGSGGTASHREGEWGAGEDTRQLASSVQSKMMTAEALVRAARSCSSPERISARQAGEEELSRMK
jgi:hypothetical protein